VVKIFVFYGLQLKTVLGITLSMLLYMALFNHLICPKYNKEQD